MCMGELSLSSPTFANAGNSGNLFDFSNTVQSSI